MSVLLSTDVHHGGYSSALQTRHQRLGMERYGDGKRGKGQRERDKGKGKVERGRKGSKMGNPARRLQTQPQTSNIDGLFEKALGAGSRFCKRVSDLEPGFSGF